MSMLSTFRNHPGLGGFQDVCQIIKELVDNSFDAQSKKIRVEFIKINDDQFRVTVTDNGIGMNDIPKALEMFHSAKSSRKSHLKSSQPSKPSQPSESSKSSKSCKSSKSLDTHVDHPENPDHLLCVGRFGVGLTLCLLHAQRLSPGSVSVVQSATANCTQFTTYKVFIDTNHDTCRCVEKSMSSKSSPEESGTSIAMVLPERIVTQAWSRIAEWLARFVWCNHRSRQTQLEVRAPALSKVPLVVLPSNDLVTAARRYLGQDILPEHVVSSSRIRLQLDKSKKSTKDGKDALRDGGSEVAPSMTCRLVVTGGMTSDDPSLSHQATLAVLRMVNGTPLLDSDESLACGVLQHLHKKCQKRVFGAFGLQLRHHHHAVFYVEDSDAVQPFLRQSEQNHSIFSSSTKEVQSPDRRNTSQKRKMPISIVHAKLLPAKLRLGTMLLLVELQAQSDTMPLTTLAKGCFPNDCPGIQDALEKGIQECFRQLQRQTRGLLLTSSQLRHAEMDARYVPAAAAAMASVLARCGHGTLQDIATGLESSLRDLLQQTITKKQKCGAIKSTKTVRGRDETQWEDEDALFSSCQKEEQHEPTEVGTQGQLCSDSNEYLLDPSSLQTDGKVQSGSILFSHDEW